MLDMFILNFVPSFCPNCGKILKPNQLDYNARASQICKCGVGFQLVDRTLILEAARQDGGDLC